MCIILLLIFIRMVECSVIIKQFNKNTIETAI